MRRNISSDPLSVLVTGIGGNVGQGILRCIRQHYPQIKLIGTDIGEATAGHHFVDEFFQVPYAYSPEFSSQFRDILSRTKVDLIIPSTDYETVYLSRISSELPQLLASPYETCSMCLDKLRTWEGFSEKCIPFAESCLPHTYRGQWKSIIVKPREGRGSRGLHLNPPSVTSFDSSYIVQELISGTEITSSFYVTREGGILGPITMSRALQSGVTERCTVVFEHNETMSAITHAVVRNFKIIGPCNIQSIARDDGSIIPFEVNCRYSGTSSIRHNFGFPDVIYGVKEYLFNESPLPPTIVAGSAIRILMDVIFEDQTLQNLKPGANSSFIF